MTVGAGGRSRSIGGGAGRERVAEVLEREDAGVACGKPIWERSYHMGKMGLEASTYAAAGAGEALRRVREGGKVASKRGRAMS